MNWIVQHPNGEYLQERRGDFYRTVPFIMFAKRYPRKIARDIAKNLIGGKAIRIEYTPTVATNEEHLFCRRCLDGGMKRVGIVRMKFKWANKPSNYYLWHCDNCGYEDFYDCLDIKK